MLSKAEAQSRVPAFLAPASIMHVASQPEMLATLISQLVDHVSFGETLEVPRVGGLQPLTVRDKQEFLEREGDTAVLCSPICRQLLST
jgi:hypothetical protein